ncbi:MAG: heparinase II/III family protein, partial [Candidatus Zipacnadales bacterium]
MMNLRTALVLATLSVSGAPTAAAWQDLFSHLDLHRSGLERVRLAVEAGDLPSAAAELKIYFRQRREPVYITDRFNRPAPQVDFDTTAAERVLRREFTFVGKPYTLPHDIDWNANPLN